MLEQLLQQLQQVNVYSVPGLARQFAVSEGLVEQMLAELVRLGYLRQVDTCNQSACTGCPQHANCSPKRPVKTWAIVKDTG